MSDGRVVARPLGWWTGGSVDLGRQSVARQSQTGWSFWDHLILPSSPSHVISPSEVRSHHGRSPVHFATVVSPTSGEESEPVVPACPKRSFWAVRSDELKGCSSSTNKGCWVTWTVPRAVAGRTAGGARTDRAPVPGWRLEGLVLGFLEHIGYICLECCFFSKPTKTNYTVYIRTQVREHRIPF